jgi:hypothetical protein
MVARCRRIAAGVLAAAVVASIAATVSVAGAPSAEAGGGDWLEPVRDRYEPGQLATLVAYYSGAGSFGSIDDGPFFAYLRRLTAATDAEPESAWEQPPFTLRPTDLRLGAMKVVDTGRGGQLEYRTELRFWLPTWLEPSTYAVMYCNASCTKGIGNLMGGSIRVGIDPEYHPSYRSWPLDEPQIANLSPDTVLSLPEGTLTAADAWAGLLPKPHVAPVAALPSQSLRITASRRLPPPRGAMRSARHLQQRLSTMDTASRAGTELCVRNIPVDVFEYETSLARRTATADVRNYQASAPYYFARGKVIAVIRGDDQRLVDEMTILMGPTITPNATHPPVRGTCTADRG